MIEFSRNVLKKSGANSKEIDPDTEYPVIIDMPEHHPGQMGGTMRLGKRRTIFKDDNSILSKYPTLSGLEDDLINIDFRKTLWECTIRRRTT